MNDCLAGRFHARPYKLPASWLESSKNSPSSAMGSEALASESRVMLISDMRPCVDVEMNRVEFLHQGHHR